MPTSADHILLVLFAVLWPLYGLVYRFPKLKRDAASARPGARLKLYWEGMAASWTLAVAAVAVWIRADRPLADLGLGAPGRWPFWVGFALVLVAVLLMARHRRVKSSASAADALP